MLNNLFTLITGRTRGQANGLHKGAGSSAHLKETSCVEICPEDMTRLGIEEGQVVRLRSDTGQAEAYVKVGDLPCGLLFIPMGPTANRLIGTDTSATGMPPYKGQRIEVERI